MHIFKQKSKTFFFLWLFILKGSCENPIEQTLKQKGEIDKNYFAPDQAHLYKDSIVWLCAQTSGSIKAAFYRLTDRDIANALITAHERGVLVEVILDPGAVNSAYSLVHQLFKAGIALYCYKPTGLLPPFPRTFPSIMHHKHIIFSGVLNEYSIVACGSLNYTNAGFNGNREQMQIRTKHTQEFLDHFELLKQCCQPIISTHFIRYKIKPTVVSCSTNAAKKFIRFLHR